jgi:hypothetical protein
MDRRLARKNVRTGVMLAAFSLFLFALSFVVAAIFLA